MPARTITITGASGKLGRAVAQELGRRVPPASVTLGSRTPAKLDDLRQLGFRVARVDFDQPPSLEDAFHGADAILLICGHGSNADRIRQHVDAIDAARRSADARVYYTSFVNPDRASLFPFAQVHEASEAHARRSDVRHTFLRNNHYAENLEQALLRALASGELALPGARGKVAYIARQDVAAASAGALAHPAPEDAYEITGAEALDLHEVAELASEAWGRRIGAREMPADEYRALLAASGLPPFVVEGQLGLRLACGAGEYAAVTRDAEALAGRPLQRMREYLGALAGAAAACAPGDRPRS